MPVRSESDLFVALGLGAQFETRHCNTCHDDYDLGYEMEMCAVHLLGDENTEYAVCCQVLRDYEEGLLTTELEREDEG